MSGPGAIPAKAGKVYFDATFLAFGGDQRGIPQVISLFLRIFREHPDFADVRIIATKGPCRDRLAALGIPDSRIIEVPALPLLGRVERCFGLASTWRYRGITGDAALIIHPEPRTVLRTRIPQLVYFHDFIIFEKFPGQERRKWLRYLHILRKYRIASRVRFKIANSRFTRSRALELYPGMDASSITALQLGTRLEARPSPRTAPGAGEPLQCLYVGSYDSRKNIPALLGNLGKVFPGRKAVLHLVGKVRPQERKGIQAMADAAKTGTTEVVLHGMLDENALARRYASAHVLLFPSLFEGFGLPIIEAMSQGMVVAAFRNSCIPEIGGDAALLAENGDFAAWGRMIEAMLSEPSGFEKRSAQSIRHAEAFGMENVHGRYLDYLRRVCAEARTAFSDRGDAP